MSRFGILGVLLLVVFSMPVSGFANDIDDFDALANELRALAMEQVDIINIHGSADEVNKRIGKGWNIYKRIDDECDALKSHIARTDYDSNIERERIAKETQHSLDNISLDVCRVKLDTVSGAISSLMFISADYYVAKKNNKAAKQIYRDIITTFVGDKYKSNVKKAEFALEDLKLMPDTDKTVSKNKKKK